jgi:glutamate N-acetyltransferase/amino-acid N-acetyltransferase
MKLLFNSGILPLGFKAAGISAQIKKNGKKDVALFYSEAPCVASGMFTANKIKAAPVVISQKHLKSGLVHAVVANSGNANCMTGKKGIEDAQQTAQWVAEALRVRKTEVLVASTGIIGVPLPIGKIEEGIEHVVCELSSKGISSAASAIMTTDTFPKEVALKCKILNKEITISGVAKGAGMIAPNLKCATMFVFLFTDAAIAKAALEEALKEAAESTFNAITIDGCMSTNDTAFVLANGEAGNSLIQKGSKEARVFQKALTEICFCLATMLVKDAEGATKFIQINVQGAHDRVEAKRLAFSVANSNLFKCAMFGCDPNWGRIAAALGSVDSHLSGEKLNIVINKKAVFKDGKPCKVQDNKFLKDRPVVIDINLACGKGQYSVYTSDLSYDYVKINADYS